MNHQYAFIRSIFQVRFSLLLILVLPALQTFAQDKEVEQTFYFTGNTGDAPNATTTSVLEAITTMSQKDAKATFVAIGNITQQGYPPKKKDRKEVETFLQQELMEPLEAFNGNVILMPGKNEWNKNGHENLDDLESFIQDNSEIEFWPNDGCPREIENLDMDNVELLMIDSQWFLEDWDDHLYLNNKCDIKTRDDFFAKFKDDLKDEQNKTVIVAVHHSILTLSQQNFIENIGGLTVEDYYSTLRQKYAGTLETLASQFPDVIFVSASDRNLQYVFDDGIPQIISGAASEKLDGVRKAKDGQFASKAHGFARLTVYKDRSSVVEFYETDNGTPKKLFEKEIRRQQPKPQDINSPDISGMGSTKKASIYTKEETDKSGMYRFLWGDHYRDVYSKKLKHLYLIFQNFRVMFTQSLKAEEISRARYV